MITKQIRKELKKISKKYTYKTLAEILDMPLSTVWAYVNNTREPSFKFIEALEKKGLILNEQKHN